MKKFRISLTSIGIKALGIFLTSCLTVLTVVFYMFKLPWYGCLFLTVVTLLLLFGCFLFFNHRVVLDSKAKLLKIYLLKTKAIELKEIDDIRVDTTNSINSKKFAFIVITLKNGEVIKTASLSKINNFNAVKVTEEKIKILNQKIKEII